MIGIIKIIADIIKPRSRELKLAREFGILWWMNLIINVLVFAVMVWFIFAFLGIKIDFHVGR